jgi:DnaJ-class molecular chaperone
MSDDNENTCPFCDGTGEIVEDAYNASANEWDDGVDVKKCWNCNGDGIL